MRRALRPSLVALPFALLAFAACFVLFSAQRTLTRSAKLVRTRDELPFTLTTLHLPTPGSPGFTPVASAPAFTSGTVLDGRFFLAGPDGLTILDPDGSVQSTLRTGLDLPAAPILQVASARLRGSPDLQVLLATDGAGLLVLQSPGAPTSSLRQLLPASKPLRELTSVLPLPGGDLLLGTRRAGVLLFSGSTLQPLPLASPGLDPTHLQVTALASPAPGSLVIATRDAGLFFLHAGTIAHATLASGLPDNQVDALALTPSHLYAGTPRGVADFDLAAASPGAADLRPTRILAPGVFAHALTLTPDARLLVGTLDQGILPFDLALRSHLRPASLTLPSTSGRIDAFLSPRNALADGVLLASTGLGWTPLTSSTPQPTGLTDRNISALAFDPAGRLFVGFFDRGLDILSPTLTLLRHLEDDHLFCLNRLLLDPRTNSLAAATANGLVLFDSAARPRQVLTRRDGLISDHINDLVFTPRGPVLATPAGLTFLGSGSGSPESLYAFGGLVNNHVYTLASDPASGRLLAGTLGGLSLLRDSAVERNFTISTSALARNWITALAPLPDGSDLIGTYGAGLQRLTVSSTGAAAFTSLDLPPSIPADLVINPNALLVTPAHIFAGTLDHGLLVFSQSTGSWSLLSSGLPSLNVTAFAAHSGELFIGTANGLVHIREDRLP